MESVLWALNLIAVCLLCIWALREDGRTPPPSAAKKTASEPEPGAGGKPVRKAGVSAAPRQKRG